MVANASKSSVWVLISGILMVAIGVYSWFHPVAALAALALYLGVVFIVAGFSYLTAYFLGSRSGWYLALGLLDVLVGIILVSHLRQTMVALPFMFAFWCLFTGSIQISAALQMRNSPLAKMWIWPLISGIVGIIVGFWILFAPMTGAVAITLLLGVSLVVNGLAAIMEYVGTRKM